MNDYAYELAHIRRLLDGETVSHDVETAAAEVAELRWAVEALVDLVERLILERQTPPQPEYPVQWWQAPQPWWLNQPTCGGQP